MKTVQFIARWCYIEQHEDLIDDTYKCSIDTIEDYVYGYLYLLSKNKKLDHMQITLKCEGKEVTRYFTVQHLMKIAELESITITDILRNFALNLVLDLRMRLFI